MFKVEKINNGYILKDEYGKENFYATQSKLITGIREILGMKKLGRPMSKNKLAEEVPF